MLIKNFSWLRAMQKRGSRFVKHGLTLWRLEAIALPEHIPQKMYPRSSLWLPYRFLPGYPEQCSSMEVLFLPVHSLM